MNDLRNAQKPDEILVEAAPEPSDDQLRKVARLAEQQQILIREIAELEAALQIKHQALKTNQEVDLPEAMTAAGLRDFSLTDGTEIGIRQIISASIPKATQDQAFAWLEKHNAGSLIKRVITIEFGKGEEAWAKKFLADLAKRKKKVKATVKQSVHAQTLGAYVREMSNKHIVVPDKLLGVFRLRKAEIKKPEQTVV